MASYLRLATERLASPGTRGSWAQRFAEGCENAGTFNGGTVAALSGTGPWLKQLYEALSPKPTFAGANWIQRLCGGGGAEFIAAAANSGGGGSPTPLVSEDFKNGVYSIGGVSKTLGETIEENLDFGGGYSTSDVVAGVGLINTKTDGASGSIKAKLTSAAASLVSASGCVVVATIVGTCPAAPDVTTYVNIGVTDLPDNNEVWEVTARLPRDSAGDPDNFGVSVDDYSDSFGSTALTPGIRKFAAVLGQPELAVSVGGGANAVGGAVPETNAARNGVTITLRSVSNTGVTVSMVVEKLEFFALADYDASDLPALSA